MKDSIAESVAAGSAFIYLKIFTNIAINTLDQELEYDIGIHINTESKRPGLRFPKILNNTENFLQTWPNNYKGSSAMKSFRTKPLHGELDTVCSNL